MRLDGIGGEYRDRARRGRRRAARHPAGDAADHEGGNGERVTIYCSRLNASRTAFRYDANDNFGAVHWIEGQYGWVISGPKDKDKLKSIASAAYDQLEQRTPPPSQGAAGQLISRRGS